MQAVTIRSRLGDVPGVTDDVVAAFDYFDPTAGHPVRHYVLLDESVKLMYEPWGWREEWYLDLVAVHRPEPALIELDDLVIDLVVEGDGPTYRMIDLEELGERLATGSVTPEQLREPLQRLQGFLDNHLHRGRDFPPRCLEPFLPQVLESVS